MHKTIKINFNTDIGFRLLTPAIGICFETKSLEIHFGPVTAWFSIKWGDK